MAYDCVRVAQAMENRPPPGIGTLRILRVAEWNPANFTSTLRQELASLFFEKLDIVGIVGTAIRRTTRDEHVQRWALQHHHFFSFGYQPSPRINKSCGGGS